MCVRSLLSIKKITQHGNRDTWVYVPDIGCYEDNNGAINWEEDITEQMYELLDVSAEDREWLAKRRVKMPLEAILIGFFLNHTNYPPVLF